MLNDINNIIYKNKQRIFKNYHFTNQNLKIKRLFK